MSNLMQNQLPVLTLLKQSSVSPLNLVISVVSKISTEQKALILETVSDASFQAEC